MDDAREYFKRQIFLKSYGLNKIIFKYCKASVQATAFKLKRIAWRALHPFLRGEEKWLRGGAKKSPWAPYINDPAVNDPDTLLGEEFRKKIRMPKQMFIRVSMYLRILSLFHQTWSKPRPCATRWTVP